MTVEPEKTLDEFFIDWCYHICDFTGGIDDRIVVLNEIQKYFLYGTSHVLSILIRDRLCNYWSNDKAVHNYMKSDNFLDAFTLHENERVQLKHVDRKYCTPHYCVCTPMSEPNEEELKRMTAQEYNNRPRGCQNPFFRLHDTRRVISKNVKD